MLMIALVIVWGLEYSVAKDALNTVDSITLITFKYTIGALIMLCILLATKKFRLIHKKDIPRFILCAIFGQILYFFCEYNAMATVPVAMVTIVLSFVPIASIIVERFLYKHKASAFLVIGSVVCVGGIILSIGADSSLLSGGKLIGYLFCVGALIAWVCYNFMTGSIASDYDSVCTAFYQMGIAALMTLPYSIFHMPEAALITPKVISEILYLGAVSAGVGFLVEIIGIQKLGPTSAAVYSNFMPVTTAIFGVFLLGQHLQILQIVGMVIVIASGYCVIREKARLDDLRNPGR